MSTLKHANRATKSQLLRLRDRVLLRCWQKDAGCEAAHSTFPAMAAVPSSDGLLLLTLVTV